ncbi:MAG: shikimate dehydrogenase [Sphingomicrobium sp.]
MTSVVRPYAEVIGDPIDHSLSPVIHGFWLEALKIEADYRRRQVRRADLPAYLAEKKADAAWKGSNVTMPLKLDALALADEPTDRALAAGAANTLVPRDGKLVAANTDVGAIATLIDRARQAGTAIPNVTLFGNGGAARAALAALRLLNVQVIQIHARDLQAATALAVEFGLSDGPVGMDHPAAGALLINATPLGMDGHDCLNCDLSAMPGKGLVFDMVSAPAETPLIKVARARGLKVITGLEMLVEQAAASFKLFFAADAPRDRDAELMQRLNP